MSLRRKRETSKQKIKNILRWQIIICGLFLLIFVLYSLYSYTIYRIGKKNTEVVIVRYESVGDQLTAEAAVLNEETTYYAPADGHFENIVKENDKVRKNDLVGYFISSSQQDKQPVLANTPGMFTLKTDGLEKVFQSINFATVTPEVFHYKPSKEQYQEYCYNGYPVYKIVNNLKPTRLLIHFPQKEFKTKFYPGQHLDIVYNDIKISNCEIKNVKRISDEVVLLAELADYPNIIDRRYIECQLIFNPQNGCLLPQKAIVAKGSKKGVYCVKGQDAFFKTVNILKKQKDMVLVEGLEANDMVIAHPGFFLRYLK